MKQIFTIVMIISRDGRIYSSDQKLFNFQILKKEKQLWSKEYFNLES